MTSRQKPAPSSTGFRWLLPRLMLALGGTLVALLILELALRATGWPNILQPHSEPPRFVFAKTADTGTPFYINKPGRITFRYDSNPRGYFDAHNQIHHDVNPSGFRGPAVMTKPPEGFRMVFLGDSFTFGEGVRNEDVYPEVAARMLRKGGQQVDTINLGVGGYNTKDSLKILQLFGFGHNPDIVVLGYTINDAEPPLFNIDPATGQPVRRAREQAIEAEAAPQQPPSNGLYQLKLGQAVWQFQRQKQLTRQTIDYYRSVNDPSKEDCKENERALRDIITLCKARDIPCVVVMFPLLFDLTDDHPFKPVHQRIGKVVTDAGGHFIDLLPGLTGKNPRDLIVHPTDQHPNETVHALAGQLVAREVQRLQDMPSH